MKKSYSLVEHYDCRTKTNASCTRPLAPFRNEFMAIEWTMLEPLPLLKNTDTLSLSGIRYY